MRRAAPIRRSAAPRATSTPRANCYGWTWIPSSARKPTVKNPWTRSCTCTPARPIPVRSQKPTHVRISKSCSTRWGLTTGTRFSRSGVMKWRPRRPPVNSHVRAGGSYTRANPTALCRHETNSLKINTQRVVTDVREDSPAWKAGLAPGMKIQAVDSQRYTHKTLDYAMKQAEHSSLPTTFTAEQDGWYHTYDVNYHGGPRYPHLARIPGKPDMLARIMAPHAS